MSKYHDKKSVEEMLSKVGKTFISFIRKNNTEQRSTKIRWRCSCGKENIGTIYSCIRISTCHSCGGKNGSTKRGASKLSFEGFNKDLKEKDWSMLSEKKDYTNSKSILDVKCDKGHQTTKSYANFRKGVGCRVCVDVNQRGHDIANIKKEFEKKGFKLLSKSYTNNKKDLNYICRCGREKKMSYSNFLINTMGCLDCAQLNCLKNMREKAYKKKPYTFPSGNIVEIQGYENYALDFLVYECGIYEDDIVVDFDEIKTITYFHKGKQHVYHPDIFVKCSNLLIEVKCKFTFLRDKERNLAKWDETIKQHDLLIMSFDRSGELKCCADWKLKSDREAFIDSMV